ncbi:MAG: DUF3168 domain-containing protein [Hyphomonadaceae bacterium]|nr:DUF3168 domain-containing protein [Hyphomonadaceae bacterium]
MSAETALAAAIRVAALDDAGVQAIVADRFYDEPPPDVVFPYLTLGRVESKSIDASEREALEHGVTLHVWSRYGGRAEALDAIAALRGCLHNAGLDVSGRRLVLLFVQFADVFRSGDGRTTHGVLRLKAITESE